MSAKHTRPLGATRFVIEGEWAGYRSSQDRVVHRRVYPASHKALRAWAEKTHSIAFTDGTRLILSVRDCRPRERVDELNGYTRLIEDCARHDVASADALHAAETAVLQRARDASKNATGSE